ncbi:LIM zinc finger domain containing protein [Entamoeba marina]
MDCFVCGKPTPHTPTYVIENKTKEVHKACFRCRICGNRLTGYLLKNNELCCIDCYQPHSTMEKCSKCGQFINGKTIKTENDTFHPRCFVCDECKKPLHDTYEVKDGQWYCLNCFNSK